LETALRLQPLSAKAANVPGVAFGATQRADDVLAWFAGAIRFTTSCALAHRNLALATAHSGRNAESIPHFARAVALNLIARRKFRGHEARVCNAIGHLTGDSSAVHPLAPPSAPERMEPHRGDGARSPVRPVMTTRARGEGCTPPPLRLYSTR
jgi:hypothetical protein